MTTETVNIVTAEANPSLAEQAAKAGIDPATLDATAQEQGAADRPSWLPDKFATVEDMAKSYAELEKKQGKAKADADANADPEGEADDAEAEEVAETPDVPAEETEVKEPTEAEKAAKDAADKAGLNLNEMSAKYWENGSLEEADYAALEKVGIPRAMVDQFADGQKAIQQANRTEVFTEVGGEDSYKDMLEWASTNYTKAEIKEYDAAMDGDKDKRMSAVKSLKARYSETNGTEPARRVEGRTRASTTDVYESVAQLQADIRNPKYASDPAFRNKVESKLDRSDIL